MFFGRFSFVFGEEDSRLCFLFHYVMEEAGRICVRDMPWPLRGRMQYDYKQTMILSYRSAGQGWCGSTRQG